MPFRPFRHPSCTLAAVFALLLSCSAAHAVQDCELDGQHVNPANGNTTAGKTGLMRCKDRDSGRLEREQELRNGKFMGLVRFYRDGQLQKEYSTNENGNQHGRSREFAPGGQVLRDANYDNGSTVGLARSFFASGQLQRATFYAQPGGERAYAEFTERGQLRELRCTDKPVLAPAADDAKWCGFGGPAQVEYFASNGNLRAKATFESGKRIRLESYFDSGKTSQQEEIAGGKRTERSFWPDGGKRLEVQWQLVERGAMKEREQEFAQNGTLVRDRRWAEGEPVSDATFYLNGQPRSRTEYGGQGRTRTLAVVDFHDNGKPAREGSFTTTGRYGQTPTGVHKRFDPQGRLVAESSYDAQGRINREKAWDEAGRLVRDDEVFEDGSRKAFSAR